MTPEQIDATAKYDALVAEKEEIERKINEAESLKLRLRELIGGWSTLGEIERARLKARDLSFPEYEKLSGYYILRIIDVGDKWISLRGDGSGDKSITRYKKDTGWPERSRDGRGAIDAQKAIEIWEMHQRGTI